MRTVTNAPAICYLASSQPQAIPHLLEPQQSLSLSGDTGAQYPGKPHMTVSYPFHSSPAFSSCQEEAKAPDKTCSSTLGPLDALIFQAGMPIPLTALVILVFFLLWLSNHSLGKASLTEGSRETFCSLNIKTQLLTFSLSSAPQLPGPKANRIATVTAQ